MYIQLKFSVYSFLLIFKSELTILKCLILVRDMVGILLIRLGQPFFLELTFGCELILTSISKMVLNLFLVLMLGGAVLGGVLTCLMLFMLLN